jgi:hypothetical protein
MPRTPSGRTSTKSQQTGLMAQATDGGQLTADALPYPPPRLQSRAGAAIGNKLTKK